MPFTPETNATRHNQDIALDDNVKLFQSSRSKTMPPSTLSNKKTKEYTTLKPSNSISNANINTDRLKFAREEAERAIKVNINC